MSRPLLLLTMATLLCAGSLNAQTSPVGLPVLDDYMRRQQLLGDSTQPASLMIRPAYLPTEAGERAVFRFMPLVWKQQYTTTRPWGINDGALIPARGYQTLVSGGVYARYGILSVQLMPELLYAQNSDFDRFPDGHRVEVWRAYNELKNRIDQPEKFGEGPYRRATWGQSSVRLTWRSLSLGLSNENLWWGPGQKNALLMTNNAPGFKHLTFNTVKPVKTPIGTFEWQIIGARLDGSGFYGIDTAQFASKGIKPFQKRTDWRYLNAMTVNYQPRWLPGLSLGGARAYTIYSGSILGHNIRTWFPLFEPFTKVTAGGQALDTIPSDQIASLWARWIFPKVNTEVYFEFGRGDHSWDLTDLILEPAHDRAYTLGFRKLLPINPSRREYIDIQGELTQFSRNVTTFLRPYNEYAKWYVHGHVRHGYTHEGQILGAGIGTSSNMQSLSASWVRDKRRVGLEFARILRDDDFWAYLSRNGLADYRTHWADLSATALVDWDYRRWLLQARVNVIGSINYMHYYDPVPSDPPFWWDKGKIKWNGQMEVTVAYML